MEVITIEKNAVPEIEVDSTLMRLKNSVHRKSILTGVLIAVRRDEENPSKMMCTASFEGYNVSIPIAEMGIDAEDMRSAMIPEYDGIDESRICGIIANSMLNAPIDFVVMGIDDQDQDDIAIVGSRRQAKEKLKNRYYIGSELAGPIITEGKVIEARVISIAKDGSSLRVEAFGVERRMKKTELVYDWVADLHKYFRVGQIIRVVVKSINLDENDLVHVKLDAKCLKENKPLQALKQMRKSDSCIGEIVSIRDGQPIFIHLLNGANAVAYDLKNDIKAPAVGDLVKCFVTGMNEEKETAIVNIVSFFS